MAPPDEVLRVQHRDGRTPSPPSGRRQGSVNQLLVLVFETNRSKLILNLNAKTTNGQSFGLSLKDLFPLILGFNNLSKDKIFVQMAVWTIILSADKYFVQGL